MTTIRSMPTVRYRRLDMWPGYRVEDDGSVWSRRRHGSGVEFDDVWHKLKQSDNGHGYFFVTLCRDGKPHHRQVHRLVLEAFVGPCPVGMQCCHENHDRADNRLVNLRWDSCKSNAQDRVRAGRQAHVRGICNGQAKLTEKKVRRIRALYATGRWTYRALAVKFGVSRPTIGRIVRGEIWTHLQAA